MTAYDCTNRAVLGILHLPLHFGTLVCTVELQVIDIASSFNMLLGRPWLHNLGVVASSLHQCVKLKLGDEIIVIHGKLVMASPKDVPLILEIQHEESNRLLSMFVMDVIDMVDYGEGVAVPRKESFLPTTWLS